MESLILDELMGAPDNRQSTKQALLSRCPSCGSRGCLKKHATYERRFVLWDPLANGGLGAPWDATLVIVRLRCTNCGHTHAVLPTGIIPYRSFSLQFILTVMKWYLDPDPTHTARAAAEKFDISPSTLFDWFHVLEQQLGMYLPALHSSSSQMREYLRQLSGTIDGVFHWKFMKQMGRALGEHLRNVHRDEVRIGCG